MRRIRIEISEDAMNVVRAVARMASGAVRLGSVKL